MRLYLHMARRRSSHRATRAPLSCVCIRSHSCPCGQHRCPHFTALPDRDLSRRAVLTAHLTAHRGGEGDKRIHPISNHKCPPIRPCESRFDGKMVRLLCVLDEPRHHGGDLRALGIVLRRNKIVANAVEDAVLHRPEQCVLRIAADVVHVREVQLTADFRRTGEAVTCCRSCPCCL